MAGSKFNRLNPSLRPNLLKVLIGSLVLAILCSCASSPGPSLGPPPVSESDKVPAKAALILGKVRDYEIQISLRAQCVYGFLADPKKRCVITTGRSFSVNVGKDVAAILKKGCEQIFGQCDTFPSIRAIPEIKAYDLVVIPKIEATVTYDEKAAQNRHIERERYTWHGGSAFQIEARIRLDSEIMDKGMEMERKLSVTGTAQDWVKDMWCYDLFTDDPIVLHKVSCIKTVSRLLKEAISDAFEQFMNQLPEDARLVLKGKSKTVVPSPINNKSATQETTSYTLEQAKSLLDQAVSFEYKDKNIPAAVSYYEKAAAAFTTIKGPEARKYLAASLHQLGMLYGDLGQYSKAIECCKRAARLHEQLGNLRDLSGSYCNLGVTYSQIGDFANSIAYLKKSLETDRSIGDTSHACVANFNLGDTYIETKDYEKAIATFGYVLDQMENNKKVSQQGLVNKRNVMAGLFRAYLLSGDLQSARGYLDSLDSHLCNGLYYFYAHDFSKAISEFKAASSSRFRPFKPEIRQSGTRFELKLKLRNEPVSHPVMSLEKFAACNIGLALSYENLGDLDKALEHYNKVIDATEAQRDLLTPDQRMFFYRRGTFGFKIFDAYEGATRTAYRKGDYLSGYLYSEKMAARLFSEDYAKRCSGKVATASVPPEIRIKEKELKELMDEIKRRQLAEKTKSAKKDWVDEWYSQKQHKSIGTFITWGLLKGVTKLGSVFKGGSSQKDLQELVKERDRLVSEIKAGKKVSEKYRAVNYPEPVPLEKLVTYPTETIVKFEVTRNDTIRWIIRDHEIRDCRSLNITRAQLEDLVRAYRQFFDNVSTLSDLDRFDDSISHKLYSVLFTGVEEFVKPGEHIIIIPDEFLTVVPFSTLLIDQAIPRTFLADRYKVTCFQSASSLTLYRRLAEGITKSKELLVVADPVFAAQPLAQNTPSLPFMRTVEENGEPKFIRLPKTREMAQKLVETWPFKVRSLLGSNACEAKLEKLPLDHYAYIVFATHGLLAEQNKLINEPALVLTNTGQALDYDGFLTAEEILRLNLNADLVSLTACHTGQGEFITGEGIMGLFRSFQVAGARNVLATLWAVSEEASTEFNECFFKHVADGDSLLDAYSKAITDLRRQGYDNPFYWGAFQLFGII